MSQRSKNTNGRTNFSRGRGSRGNFNSRTRLNSGSGFSSNNGANSFYSSSSNQIANCDVQSSTLPSYSSTNNSKVQLRHQNFSESNFQNFNDEDSKLSREFSNTDKASRSSSNVNECLGSGPSSLSSPNSRNDTSKQRNLAFDNSNEKCPLFKNEEFCHFFCQYFTGSIAKINLLDGTFISAVIDSFSDEYLIGLTYCVKIFNNKTVKLSAMKCPFIDIRSITITSLISYRFIKKKIEDILTDAEISAKKNLFNLHDEHGSERRLIPYYESGDVPSDVITEENCLEIEKGDNASWFPPEEMFLVNKDKFGVESTFDNEMTEYTTPIDRNAPDYDQRFKEADEIASSIEKANLEKETYGGGHHHHFSSRTRAASDDEDFEGDEEMRYSAVYRQDKSNYPKSNMSSMRNSSSWTTNRRTIPMRHSNLQPSNLKYKNNFDQKQNFSEIKPLLESNSYIQNHKSTNSMKSSGCAITLGVDSDKIQESGNVLVDEFSSADQVLSNLDPTKANLHPNSESNLNNLVVTSIGSYSINVDQQINASSGNDFAVSSTSSGGGLNPNAQEFVPRWHSSSNISLIGSGEQAPPGTFFITQSTNINPMMDGSQPNIVFSGSNQHVPIFPAAPQNQFILAPGTGMMPRPQIKSIQGVPSMYFIDHQMGNPSNIIFPSPGTVPIGPHPSFSMRLGNTIVPNSPSNAHPNMNLNQYLEIAPFGVNSNLAATSYQQQQQQHVQQQQQIHHQSQQLPVSSSPPIGTNLVRQRSSGGSSLSSVTPQSTISSTLSSSEASILPDQQSTQLIDACLKSVQPGSTPLIFNGTGSSQPLMTAIWPAHQVQPNQQAYIFSGANHIPSSVASQNPQLTINNSTILANNPIQQRIPNLGLGQQIFIPNGPNSYPGQHMFPNPASNSYPIFSPHFFPTNPPAHSSVMPFMMVQSSTAPTGPIQTISAPRPQALFQNNVAGPLNNPQTILLSQSTQNQQPFYYHPGPGHFFSQQAAVLPSHSMIINPQSFAMPSSSRPLQHTPTNQPLSSTPQRTQ